MFTMNATWSINSTKSVSNSLDIPANYPEYHAANDLVKWTGLVIVVAGCTGNILSFLVMSRKTMKTSSGAVYFRALAIADIGTLLCGHLTAWIYAVTGIKFSLIHSWTCKLFYFIYYTIGDDAVWFITAMTFDRFIAVVFPLKARGLCIVKNAKRVCIFLVLLAVAKNTHLLITRGAQYGDDHESKYVTNTCGWPNKEFEYFEKFIRPWVAFSLYAFIPIAFIFVFNSIIVARLLKLKKVKAKQQNLTSSTQQNGTYFSAMTAMFLSVSFLLLLLLIPSISLIVSIPYWSRDAKSQALLKMMFAITDTLVALNHSINFLLYCMTGRRFRREFLLMVGCERNNAVEPREQITAVPQM